MKRKLISICLMIALISLSVFTLVACGANAGNVSDGNTEVATYQNLRVFNTGLKLTQEELLDRIKADYLKENKGYLDTDEIVVMVSLEGKSLIDDYIDEYSDDYSSVAEYAASEVGSNKRIYLQAQQEDAIRRLTQNGLIENVKCSYDTVMNGFAATIKYGNLRALENSSGVTSVIISDTFNPLLRRVHLLSPTSSTCTKRVFSTRPACLIRAKIRRLLYSTAVSIALTRCSKEILTQTKCLSPKRTLRAFWHKPTPQNTLPIST